MNKKRFVIFSTVSIIIFLSCLITVTFNLDSLDNSISNWAMQITGNTDGFLIFLGNFSEIIMILIGTTIVILLYFQRRKKQSVIFALSLTSGYVLKEIIKAIVHRERPAVQMISETGYSFPSGHAVLSVILFSMIIYFYKEEIKNYTARSLFIALGVLLILLVGFSRIYLNVHWLTDVVGGYALGFLIFSLGILLSSEINKRNF